MADSAELDVAYVAKLARLSLSAEETQLFQAQLAEVLGYATTLRDVDVSSVEAVEGAQPMFNVFREDEATPSLSVAEALANAPRQANSLFVVTKVVE